MLKLCGKEFLLIPDQEREGRGERIIRLNELGGEGVRRRDKEKGRREKEKGRSEKEKERIRREKEEGGSRNKVE